MSSVLESKENRVQPLTSTSFAQVENKSKGNSKSETSYDKTDLSLESLIEKMESIMEVGMNNFIILFKSKNSFLF